MYNIHVCAYENMFNYLPHLCLLWRDVDRYFNMFQYLYVRTRALENKHCDIFQVVKRKLHRVRNQILKTRSISNTMHKLYSDIVLKKQPTLSAVSFYRLNNFKFIFLYVIA